MRPHLHLREPDLVQVTEEYRTRRAGAGGGWVGDVVGALLLALVVLQVVPVDLTRERHPGEMAQQLVDRSGNKRKLFSQLKLSPSPSWPGITK